MDNFFLGTDRMNILLRQELETIRAERAIQEAIDLATEIELGQPILQQVEPEVIIQEPRRRGRPPTRDVSVLRRRLEEFRRTASVDDEINISLRGNLTLRQGTDIIFDVLQPTGNARFGVFTHFDEQNNERFYPVSQTGQQRMNEIITGRLVEEGGTESDRELVAAIQRADSITFIRLPDYDPRARQRRTGAFFKHRHKTAMDLTKFGVYGLDEDIPDSACLIVALEHGGLDEKKIDKIKLMMNAYDIPVCKLQEICDRVDICIELKQMRINTKSNKVKTHTKVYGDKKNQTFKIGLVDGHYFIIDNVPITKYALENHYIDSSKFYIKDKSGRTDKSRTKDSFYVISYMFEHKEIYLKALTANDMIKSIHHSEIDEFSTLEYDEDKDVSEVKHKEPSKTTKDRFPRIVYLDFETDTSNGEHKPYLVHWIDDDDKDNKEQKFIGSNCAKRFLMSLTCDTLIYAHNAGYDFRFLVPHLMNIKPLMRGSGLITCNAMFYNYYTSKTYKICIKDTYKIISSPLRDFGEMFQLEQDKEVMPYSAYDTNSINRRFKHIDELKKCPELQNDSKLKQFLSNCRKWNLIKNDSVDIIGYSSKYCHIDCVVLKNGFNKFREWMLNVTGIDTHNVVSIPSLVHKYLVREGVYEGCYQTSSVPRAFMQKCLVGGRVMCKNNNKLIREECIMQDYINDFDAVSLYPSAMKRLADIGGFLKGTPKVLEDLSYDFLKRQDGYFVKIKINSVGTRLNFPYMSYMDEDNVRQFTNDMEGRIMFVDKISLEDYIKFHNITFDVIQGYYFNEGRNNTIGNIIEGLFNERLKKKEEKNPIQAVYKLIMNSAYGKTLLRPIENSLCVVDSSNKMKQYVVKYFDSVQEVIPLSSKNNKYVIKTKNAIQQHENLCHVGIEILSMSKRIMGELMYLAEKYGLEIYYTDTDSIHIKNKHIEKLEELFKKEYGRELIGKGMGQFHSDFSIKQDGKKATDVVSTCGIFLAKKCYLDVLEGNIDGKKVHDYHIRMKSIPSSTILYEAERQYGGDVKKMYLDLYDGKKVEFDLLEGGRKCRFNCGSDLGVSSVSKFIRTIQFA